MENNVAVDPNKNEDKQSIIFFTVSLVFFIIVLGLYIFFFLQRSNKPTTVKFVDIPRPDTEFFALDPETKDIVKIEEDPTETVITDLDFSGEGFRPMGLILKGYFDSIDLDQNIFKMKNQLNQARSLQLLEFDTTKINTFYCWPEEVPSDNGPIDIRTIDMGLSAKSAMIYNPDERGHALNEIDDYVSENIFVFMQLEDEYDIAQTNYVKKLILIGCL